MENLTKCKAELKSLDEETERRKRLETEAQELKIQFRKSLNKFRQKLRERLKEKHDPLIGSVMRCVDDSMAYNFMQQHKESNLSIG